LVEEADVRVAGIHLSGLVATPLHAEPRALIVAIHGAGVHAGYFDAQNAPGLSLLNLASSAGYLAWAPDRPGVGASAELSERKLSLTDQAEILLEAIDTFRSVNGVGGRVLLVGHSYGLKVGWTMAALDTTDRLLGVDGSGAGLTYAFDWDERQAQGGGRRPRLNARDEMWGPDELYPHAARRRDLLPLNEGPAVKDGEGANWPSELRAMAHRIQVPLRITFGHHDGIWRKDEDELVTSGDLFVHTSCAIEIEPYGGHNLSLGWAARAYHLKVLSFLETCLLPEAAGRPRTRD
jgi:pimeloyl-ACP methyl ester carboxylesterase